MNLSAFIEVKFFGTSITEKLNRLTSETCTIISDELNTSPSKTYVKYEEVKHWGWNGRNF